jgi:hypothetical protein
MSEVLAFIKEEVQTHSDLLNNDVLVESDTDIFNVTDSLARLEVMFSIENEYFPDNNHDINMMEYTTMTCKQLADLIEDAIK